MFTSWSLDIILFKAGREKYGKLIFPCRTGQGKLWIFFFFYPHCCPTPSEDLKIRGGGGGGE